MDKVDSAIFRLQDAADMSERLYQKPLVLTYSGGKDSDVLIHLADAAGIDYEVQHSLTTVDAPETIYHIRDVFHRLENDGIQCTVDIHHQPRLGGVCTMWNLIPRMQMPPTSVARYCCARLKETGGKHRFLIMGVRRAESTKRKDRHAFEVIHGKKQERMSVESMDNQETREAFESCPIKGQRSVNPIVDWTNEEIWDYIHSQNIQTNPLYECGYDRVGCIGCPLVGRSKRILDFERYPKYKENYIRAFDRMLDERERRGLEPWRASENNGEAVFEWWISK